MRTNVDENGDILDTNDRRRMYALGNRLWHTDASFVDPPGRYSLLSARVLPAASSDTEFACMRAAYDALDAETKTQIEDLKVHHSIAYSRETLGFEFTPAEKEKLKGAVHPLVRTQKQLDRVLEELDDAPGIVLYTLLERELANRLEEKCRTLGLPCLSIMGPVLQLFHSYLGGETKPRVGAQHALDADYFKRIDALNFTMMHDDGQHTDDLEHADVVLVGISRTSKSPTSIYLANRGVKTANIPLVPGVAPPPNLETLKNPLVVGLTASPERIVQIRQNRLLGLRAEHGAELQQDLEGVAALAVLGERDALGVEHARELARVAAAHLAVGLHARREQTGAEQPLEVEDPVVAALPQLLRQPQKPLRPAAALEDENLVDRRARPHDRREDLPHHPRDAQVPHLRLEGRGDLQPVDDVAQGGRFDDEELGHGADRGPSPRRSGQSPIALL